MTRRRTARKWLLCAVLLGGCGLRSSNFPTRPAGHVRVDGPESDAAVATVIDGGADTAAAVRKTDGGGAGSSGSSWGSVDCQGTEQQVNDCIINAPTKNSIPAVRAKPTLTYQTCGAQ